MKKGELRTLYRAKRKDLTEQQLEDLSIAIANQAINAPVWEHSTYHLFLPITHQREVETSFLLTVLQGKDKEVVVSRSDFGDGSMKHFLLTDNTVLKTNSYGIPEPQSGIEVQAKDLEVVFIPLLAYDRHGNRVGYGKGFYDRFLAQCSENTLKVGLSFFPPEEEVSDIIPEDIRLDLCVTPERWYDLRD